MNFTTFTPPVLNDNGEAAFTALLTGDSIDDFNRRGIWSEHFGSLRKVARRGDPVPGMPGGVTYRDFVARPLLNNAGQTAFIASFNRDDTFIGQGVLSDSSGSLALVAQTGEELPSGVTVNEFSSLVLNNAGQTAFWAFFLPNNVGVWSEGSGALDLVARNGLEAPDTSGKRFGFTSAPLLNDLGQTAFTANLMNPGGTPTNDGGIWVDTSGVLRRVARIGEQVPDMSSGVTYWSFNSLAINNTGQTAFEARIILNGPVGEGIWSEGTGTLRKVIAVGDQAPGLPAGVTFFDFDSPVLNNAGHVAFTARFTESPATSNRGLWSETSDGLKLVARSGDPAPGTPAGVVFSNLSEFTLFSNIVLNGPGQIAFMGSLSGDGINSSNHLGIWATDLAGVLQLLVRTGELLEVASSDWRTVSAVHLIGGTGNGDGRASGFNELGQLAFWARFTDGSEGLFVSKLVAVPEPSAWPLLVFAVPGTFIMRGRARKGDAAAH